MAEKPTPTSPGRQLPIGRLLELGLGLTLLAFLIIRAVPTWQGQGNPVAFQLGPFGVRWYGIILMTGAYCGARIGEWEARRRGLDTDHVWNILLWGLILAVIVSRLLYVLGDLGYFLANPVRIFGFEGGAWVGLSGLTIHGALLGAVLAVVLYVRHQRLDFWTWIDVGAPGFITGQIIGRWGNFYNMEAYGRPTTLPWGVRIPWTGRLPPYNDLLTYPETTRFHPTFLYESLLNLAFLFLMLFLARRYGERLVRGEIFFIYGMLYAVGRSLIELVRVDSIYLGPLPGAHVLSIILFLLCAGLLAARRWVWKVPPGPLPEKPHAGPEEAVAG